MVDLVGCRYFWFLISKDLKESFPLKLVLGNPVGQVGKKAQSLKDVEQVEPLADWGGWRGSDQLWPRPAH